MSTPVAERRSTARRLSLDDLPVPRTDIELSDPPRYLRFTGEVGTPTKIVALIRFHTHPMGVVVLDATRGPEWSTHAPQVWAEVGDAVNSHLESDGLRRVSDVNALSSGACLQNPSESKGPRCLRRRDEVLERAPFITVVVATHDRPESARACLDALTSMVYPGFEIVVVDNDPSDERTARMVMSYQDARVRYLREDQRGLASAHNCGLAAARGPIVAFVDDDVVVDAHWLTAIAEAFTSTDGVGCVTGLILPAQLETPAQLLLEQHGGFDKGFEMRCFDDDRMRPADRLFPFTAGQFGSGANMAFDTAILRALGGFDPAIGAGTFARGGDDLASFFRVVTAGHRLVYQPAAVVWHRHHRDMPALCNQAYGYGVGLGAFVASSVTRNPRTILTLLRRLPRGLGYALRSSSTRNRDRYTDLPAEIATLERRGLLFGPIAYLVSRWRTRHFSSLQSYGPGGTP
ncbi:hypothetical protein B9C99_20180 [Rhodococcus sp. BUPNP1]|nr:hypothetical protein B9C99_20180 [Rhodococcus sp. BUPNP1]